MNSALKTLKQSHKDPLMLAVITGLALMPLIGVLFPRFYAVGPGLIGVIGIVATMIATRTLPKTPKAFIIIPGALWALSMISVSWSIAPNISLERSLKLLAVFTPCICLLTLLKNAHIEKAKPFLPFILISLLLSSLLIMFELNFDSVLYILSRGAGDEMIYSTAIYNRATVAITLLAFPCYFILKNTILSRSLTFFLLGGILLMLFSSQSQSAQLGLIVGIATYFVFPYSRPKAWYALTAIICALILGAPFIATFLYDYCATALNEMPFFKAGSGYAGGRTEIWNFVSERALQRPLTGFGIEATRTIRDFDTEMMYHEATHVLHPHNFAVQFWMEFGIIGAVVASTLIGYILWLIKSLEHTAQRIALPTFMATLTIAAIAYGFWQSWWLGLLFMLTGLCILAVKVSEQAE